MFSILSETNSTVTILKKQKFS